MPSNNAPYRAKGKRAWKAFDWTPSADQTPPAPVTLPLRPVQEQHHQSAPVPQVATPSAPALVVNRSEVKMEESNAPGEYYEMDKFMRLPPEIRNMIYAQCGRMWVNIQDDSQRWTEHSLALTDDRVREEFRDWYHSNSVFMLDHRNAAAAVAALNANREVLHQPRKAWTAWLDRLEQRDARFVRHIKIYSQRFSFNLVIADEAPSVKLEVQLKKSEWSREALSAGTAGLWSKPAFSEAQEALAALEGVQTDYYRKHDIDRMVKIVLDLAEEAVKLFPRAV